MRIYHFMFVVCAALILFLTAAQGAQANSKVPVMGIYGKIKIVNSNADYKVKVVDNFPDLRVKQVKNFPDGPGKWQFVDSFPDYTIQFVDNFPDFTIKFVDNFPGKP